jgi:ElaB/YqjD/DUF883 family membrane-anchored ribosome-binding protein
MFLRQRRMWAAAALMVVALAACGGGGGGGKVSAKEFAAKICPNLKKFVTDAAKLQTSVQTQIGSSSSLEDAKNALLDALDTLATDFSDLSQTIKDAGTPDVENGEELVSKATTALDNAHDAIVKDKDKVEALPTDNPQQFATQVQTVFQGIQSDIQASTSLGGNVNSPELNKAFATDPTCKSIGAGSTP